MVKDSNMNFLDMFVASHRNRKVLGNTDISDILQYLHVHVGKINHIFVHNISPSFIQPVTTMILPS